MNIIYIYTAALIRLAGLALIDDRALSLIS
jgi:hypothetical protein